MIQRNVGAVRSGYPRQVWIVRGGSQLLAAVALVLTACSLPSEPASPEDLAAPFDQARVTLEGERGEGEVELSVHVADTPELRRRGLMGWESLPERTGMLFVFEEDTRSGFWMKDTLIPLSIAFADADGRIHTVLDMEPCRADPCPSHAPDEPYRYALEVEQGAFDEIGVGSGWRLDGPPLDGATGSNTAASHH